MKYGNIILDGVIFNGDVDLANISATGIVSLKEAVINGYLDIDGAKAERFDLVDISVAGYLSAGCNSRDGSYLSRAFINGDVNVADCLFRSPFVGNNMTVGGDFLSSNAEYKAALVLSKTKLRGTLDLEEAQIKKCAAKKIEAGAAYLQNTNFYEAASFHGSIFRDECLVYGATFHGDADFSGVEARDGIDGEEDGSTLDCRGMFCLAGARSGGDIDLDSASLGSLDIRKAEIEGNFYLQNSEIKGDFFYVGGLIKGSLELEDASVNVLTGLTVEGGVSF